MALMKSIEISCDYCGHAEHAVHETSLRGARTYAKTHAGFVLTVDQEFCCSNCRSAYAREQKQAEDKALEEAST